METRTHSISLRAHPDATFAYLADIENMPRWAMNFCSSAEHKDGFTRVATPQGPLIFILKSDPRTGVIDFVGGPTTEAFTTWHSRVLPSPGGGSLFVFTAGRQPGESAEDFSRQCDLLGEELERLREQLDGAERKSLQPSKPGSPVRYPASPPFRVGGDGSV